MLKNIPNIIIKKYSKNQIVFSEGEICNHIGILISGSVSISTLTYDEKEYLITRIYEGDFFGENLLFNSKPFFLGDIISDDNTTIGFINKNQLLDALANDKELLSYYLSALANIHLKSQQKIKILSQKSIRDKIMFYLKYNNQVVRSKTEIAKILNIPRPSFMRELAKIKNEGIIKMINKRIQINNTNTI